MTTAPRVNNRRRSELTPRSVRVSPDEDRDFKAGAAKLGLSFSDFMRAAGRAYVNALPGRAIPNGGNGTEKTADAT